MKAKCKFRDRDSERQNLRLQNFVRPLLFLFYRKLTENELLDLWGYGFPFENMQNSIEVIRLDDGHKVEINFLCTEYGDDTQCNYSGDFAEEEE